MATEVSKTATPPTSKAHDCIATPLKHTKGDSCRKDVRQEGGKAGRQRGRKAQRQRGKEAERQKGKKAEGQKGRKAESQSGRKVEMQEGRSAEMWKSHKAERLKNRDTERKKTKKEDIHDLQVQYLATSSDRSFLRVSHLLNAHLPA